MGNKLDSTSLFLSQVNQHAEALGGLLGGAAQEPIDRDLIGRCILSTRMLSKSASLMDLAEWRLLLDPFQSLLELYRDKNLAWDERIADVTSGIIEKEDLLVAGLGAVSNLEDAVSADELRALRREVEEISRSAVETTPVGEPRRVGGAPDPERAQDRFPQGIDGEPDRAGDTAEHRTARREADVRPAESAADGRGPQVAGATPDTAGGTALEKGLTELRRRIDALAGKWGSADYGELRSSAAALEELRTHLLVIGFHAFSMERTAGTAAGAHSVPFVDRLTPLRVAIEDHARAASAARGRSIDLAFSGEDLPIDARLLQPLHIVLQHLVSDVLLRCGRDDLRIEIGVEDLNGAYRWTLRDNGESFVSDSHVDREEYLAFYPGLREARKILGDLHSLLWVETDGSEGTRFAFTVPPTLQDRGFAVWRGIGLAVLSSQFVGLYGAGDVEMSSDTHGERVAADGGWVPLLRLGHLFTGAPTDGDRIAVIGSLEKRVAFFVEGECRTEKGAWKKDSGGAGRGMGAGVVKIGDARVPLVEAGGLLQKYISIVDAVLDEKVSGGVDEVVSDSSHTQANREKDAPAPPEKSSNGNDVDVLVVEENDALRRTLGSALRESGLRVKTAGGLEAAMAFLDKGRPAVVISDFRVPTMAAKTIADRLRLDGKTTPVLVTTTHTGNSAEVLVKRLGVTGYIPKPVDLDDVVARVAECVSRGAERSIRPRTGLAI